MLECPIPPSGQATLGFSEFRWDMAHEKWFYRENGGLERLPSLQCCLRKSGSEGDKLPE
jgi:hypothetical protein